MYIFWSELFYNLGMHTSHRVIHFQRPELNLHRALRYVYHRHVPYPDCPHKCETLCVAMAGNKETEEERAARKAAKKVLMHEFVNCSVHIASRNYISILSDIRTLPPFR